MVSKQVTNGDGLTRRELIRKGAIFGGTLMWVTPVVQTVGMSRAVAQEVSRICVEQYAASVVRSAIGTRRDGSDVLANRSVPANAVGNTADFFSLGFKLPGHPPGGSLTLAFAERAYRASGAEVVVVETTGTTNPPYPQELADVYLSEDDVTYVYAGTASNAGTGQSVINIPNSLDFVQYVRVVEATPLENFPVPQYNDADGFDVRAVRIACPEE